MSLRRLGWLAAGLTGVALLAVGFGLINIPPGGAPGAPGKVDPGNRTAGRTPLWGVWIAVIQGACE